MTIKSLIPSSATENGDLVDKTREHVPIEHAKSKFEVQHDPENLNWFKINKPVHENLTLAALRGSALNNRHAFDNVTLDTVTQDQYEYIRGVFWNDDPRCLLYDDKVNDNRDFGTGAAFLADFKTGDSHSLTQRTHFGDMQWLHAMANNPGEKASFTRDRFRTWFYVVRDLWSNHISENTQMKDTGMLMFFKNNPTPGTLTLRQLFMGTTPSYKSPNIRARALASCLHIIQDSYARGHVFRADDGNGPVIRTHCYKGQDKDAHEKWDEKGGDNLDPRNLDSFNGVYGGRQAITMCCEFINLMQKGAPPINLDKNNHQVEMDNWINTRWFVISPDAQLSDNKVE